MSKETKKPKSWIAEQVAISRDEELAEVLADIALSLRILSKREEQKK